MLKAFKMLKLAVDSTSRSINVDRLLEEFISRRTFMFRIMIAIFMIFNAAQAMGSVARSEEWFQAEKGEMFSEINFGYLDTDFESALGDSSYNSQDVFFSFEMGLTENTAWFTNVGYFMGDSDVSDDLQGTRALSTGLRLQQRFQSGRLITLFKASHELESASDDNQNGAVFSLTVGGGYEHFFDQELVGAFIQFPFLTTDFEGTDGQPTVTKGVPVLSVYGETQRIDSLVIGLKANYRMSGANLQKEYRIDSGTIDMIESLLYARYDINNKVSVLANGGYLMSLSEDSSTGLEGVTGYQGQLGARYKF